MNTTTATRTTPRPEPTRPQTPSRQDAPSCLRSARPTRAMQRRLVAHLVG